jgi:DNA-binding NarL/FixJ family response regulator
MQVSVLIAEDNFLAREGIERALGRARGVGVAGVCTDLDSALRAVRESPPDVVLTDIRMPPTHTDEGLRLAAELRRTHPQVGVVVLSQHAEPVYAMSLFSDGIEGRGYLLKERLASMEELDLAIHEVAAGRSYLDPGLVGPILSSQGPPDGRLAKLTPREYQILALVAEGRSNSAIAEATGVTKRAVERHINAIFTKAGITEDASVNRRVQITLAYLQARSDL